MNVETLLRAIETTATIDDEHHLVLDAPLPKSVGRVRVIILFADDSEIQEEEWLRAAMSSPSYSFLKDSREDIYSLNDGQPFHDEG